MAALMLSGCATTMAPAPAPVPLQSIAIPKAGAEDASGAVRIVPSHDVTSSASSMVVRMHAEADGLVLPLKFHWYLGNGHEWNGPEPPPQTYIVGRYDVILTVTDGIGRVRKASMKVDAESHGCAF